MMTQFDGLSEREQDVVKLLLEGKSNKLIGAALHISDRTVEFHLKNVYEKMQVRSRVELILKLGNSTVAEKGEAADNGDHPSSRNWVASLKDAISQMGKEFHMKTLFTSDVRNAGGAMNFQESIVTCLRKYAEFNGRASRSEFWWFTLFVTLVTTAGTYISEAVGGVLLTALLLPFLAAGARRLRDSDKSVWWELFLLVPAAGFVVVAFIWALPPVEAATEHAEAA